MVTEITEKMAKDFIFRAKELCGNNCFETICTQEVASVLGLNRSKVGLPLLKEDEIKLATQIMERVSILMAKSNKF